MPVEDHNLDPKRRTPFSDYKLAREIRLIFRGMADHWMQHEEPTIARELVEISRRIGDLAVRMRKRRPKL